MDQAEVDHNGIPERLVPTSLVRRFNRLMHQVGLVMRVETVSSATAYRTTPAVVVVVPDRLVALLVSSKVGGQASVVWDFGFRSFQR